MWAGVCIDHDFPTKRRQLTTPHNPRGLRTKRGRPGPSAAVQTLLVNQASPAAAALITARASAHCEILAPACHLTQQLIFTRRHHSLPTAQVSSPADRIAACEHCTELIEHTHIATTINLRYITTDHHSNATRPVYWRQQRWITLDHFGHLANQHQPATTARPRLLRIA
ncbi:hypothetical protein ACT16_13045 [Mycobacterium heckeshornense]|nr:hypothetical protein ACT16_13045 [Mycobacterium heckeshornense]